MSSEKLATGSGARDPKSVISVAVESRRALQCTELTAFIVNSKYFQ